MRYLLLCVLLFSTASYGNEHHPQKMEAHHLHILLNHAMIMAEQGANLKMLGQMGMAKDLDKLTRNHGDQMILMSQSLLKRILSAESVIELRNQKRTEENKALWQYTDRLIKNAEAYLDTLKNMPKAPAE